MELRDVVMSSRTLFNLDEYTNGYPGLLIALNLEGKAIGYVQSISDIFYWYTTNDGETYEDYLSITGLLKANPAIHTFKLLELNGNQCI